jgi:hypothetical protein
MDKGLFKSSMLSVSARGNLPSMKSHDLGRVEIVQKAGGNRESLL